MAFILGMEFAFAISALLIIAPTGWRKFKRWRLKRRWFFPR